MGYSTSFYGTFSFDREPPREVIERLIHITTNNTRDLDDGLDYPSFYCQWILTDDNSGLKWDENEKFYEYEEWLQWIIDEILTPAGIQLSGTVEFQGDETVDHGWLTVTNGIVVRESSPAIREEFDELKRFKDFVLAHPYADEILESWREHNE